MAKKYKQKDVDLKILNYNIADYNKLYNADFINWKGKTIDTNQYYTEIVAIELVGNFLGLDAIKTISRKKTYKIDSHMKISFNLDKGYEEKIFAKRICGLEINEIGKIIDYEVPLSNTIGEAGEIDLISYNKKLNTLYLLELKYKGNKKETLLRSMLEIYTYFKLVSHKKILADYNLPKNTIIKPAVILPDNEPTCNAYLELKELFNNKRPYLKELSKWMEMNFFTIDIKSRRW